MAQFTPNRENIRAIADRLDQGTLRDGRRIGSLEAIGDATCGGHLEVVISSRNAGWTICKITRKNDGLVGEHESNNAQDTLNWLISAALRDLASRIPSTSE